MTSYAPRTAPPTRGRRWPRRLIVTVVLLAGVLVAVDRIGVAVAESAVAQTLQNSQHLANRPRVSIDGFPFLTQLASGDYDKIGLSDDDVTVGQYGRTVTLQRLQVTLHGVKVARDFKNATADSATATARMNYAALSQTLGTKLSYAGSGRVKATASVLLGSRTLRGSVIVTPRLAGHSLQFASPQMSVDGAPAPHSVTDALAGVFGAPIPLGSLPYALTVESLSANADGVFFTLSARHLSFQR